MGEAKRTNENWPNEKESCYDCGSTVPGHHTPSCDLAPQGAIKDLPQQPGTQYWTGDRVDSGMYPLEAIGNVMGASYVECSDVAMDYLVEHGVEGLDEPDCFTDDESKSLTMISLVVWQTIAAALRVEDFKPSSDSKTFDAIIKQVRLAHFG